MTDLSAVTARMQSVWSAGDFAAVGSMITIVSETLCETVELQAGRDVLDVATGSGNTAIAAARRFTRVTGLDFVPSLLERGRMRASAEGVSVTFVEGDAQSLPFPDDSFDVLLSTFGVMFAPDQALAASEMLRVLRPGGVIGMANWVPEGAIGELFRIASKHNPPPPGLMPAVAWGATDRLSELFPGASLSLAPRTLRIVMPSPAAWLDHFRRYFGPIVKAYEAIGPEGEDALTADLMAFLDRNNTASDGTLVFPQGYVDVVVRP